MHLRATELINGLIIIAHNANISSRIFPDPAQRLQKLKLRHIRILILVNHNHPETMYHLSSYCFIFFKNLNRAHNQIAKIRISSRKKPLLIRRINLRKISVLVKFRKIIFRRKAVILAKRNSVGRKVRLLFCHSRNSLHNQRGRIVIVVNSKIRVKFRLFRITAQKPRSKRMKSLNLSLLRKRFKSHRALLHFIRGFFCKSNRKNRPRLNILVLNQICYFCCNNPCFSRPRACKNQQGRTRMRNRLSLLRVQRFKIFISHIFFLFRAQISSGTGFAWLPFRSVSHKQPFMPLMANRFAPIPIPRRRIP